MRLRNVLLGGLLLVAGLSIGLLIGSTGSTGLTDTGVSEIELAASDAICAAHRVPEDRCIRCNPGLIESLKAANDWCAGHDVPESLCTRCNPELIPEFETRGDWCVEHTIPESQCTLCDPEPVNLVAAGGVEDDDPHAGHDHAEGEPDDDEEEEEESTVSALESAPYPGLTVIYRTNQALCPTDQAIIQFATVETATRAGLEVRPVVVAPMNENFEAPAEVVFDKNRTSLLTSTLPVSVVRWEKEPGATLKAGDIIAMVESPDMAELQGAYLEAHADWLLHRREAQRSADLVANNLVDSASYERAQAELTAASARRVQTVSRLQLAGLNEADLEAMQSRNTVSSRFGIRASVDGFLLERIAQRGVVLDPGTELARLGDPQALWIEGRIRESDLTRVVVGQKVDFTTDGNALHHVTGTVIWISQFLDPHTRTATLRIRPDSGSKLLRAHEFGRIEVGDGPEENTIIVPRDAVQWEGCCNVVFVREAPDRFRPQKVKLGRGDGGYYRVLQGLEPGSEVVVRGSFLLKTELKKSSIGAGCCGLEAS
jgi:cobalt-zinc-cadmium efflux system membrane fusion protein